MVSFDKEVKYYVKEDPMLGEIRGLDPWAVNNGIHMSWADQTGAEGIMLANDKNCNPYGTVHGGVLGALADTVAGHSLVAQGLVVVTQSSTLHYLRPANGKMVRCVAKPQKVGKNICVVSVDQYDENGVMLTTALMTFSVVGKCEPYILKRRELNL